MRLSNDMSYISKPAEHVYGNSCYQYRKAVQSPSASTELMIRASMRYLHLLNSTIVSLFHIDFDVCVITLFPALLLVM